MKKLTLLLVSLLSFGVLFAQKIQLVAHYPLNGNAHDSTIYKNNGQIIGNVVPATNRFGQTASAMQFSKNGYILVPNNPTLARITDSLTITVWAKLNCLNNYWFTILCKSDKDWEDRDSPHFRLQITRNTAALCSEVIGSYVYNFLPDTWYFLAVTFTGKRLQFYVNGLELMNTNTFYKLKPNNYPLIIGADPPGNKEFFCGTMDDLKIYSQVLSSKDLTTVMNSEVQSNGSPFIKRDTTYITDTLRKFVVKTDTVINIKNKTVVKSDTLRKQFIRIDTLVNIQHKYVNKTDTIYKTVEKTDTIVRKVEKTDYSDLPSSFEGKPIQYQNTVIVSSRDIIISAFDDAREDNDIVSININGIWVKRNYPIRYKSYIINSDAIELHLISASENYLITKAVSEGNIPPCTLCLSISDGKSQHHLVKIHCAKGYMGGIRIVYKP